MSRLKILAVLVAVVFLASCSGGAGQLDVLTDGSLSAAYTAISSKPGEMDEDGYRLAASNDNYSLYYEETGLTVKVKNNRTGEVMESAAQPDENSSDAWKNFVNSGLVLEYYRGKAVTVYKINMISGSPETGISLIENGFAAEINFKSIGISLSMFVTLDENGIRVQIPNSSIQETNEQYRLAAIYVLPFLGYTDSDLIEGYMLIPDGCGALIPLKDNNEKFSQPYKSKVYGGNYTVEPNHYAVQKYDDSIATKADSAEIFAPVFGMVHSSKQNAFLGIVERGQYNAEIYAYPNGVITRYNWITARYIYREVTLYLTGQSGSISTVQEPRETFDISVYYSFASSDRANYAGLAENYRSYLIEQGTLTEADGSAAAMRLDFFAGDVEKALFGNKFVKMTDVDDIDTILEEITGKGIRGLTVSYKGWQTGGIYGNLTDSVRFGKKIGSLREYENLSEKYADEMEFMLYGDFLNVYSSSASRSNIYQYNGKVFSDDTYLTLHPNLYRNNPFKVADLIEGFLDSLSGGRVGISFAGITDEVYSFAVNGQSGVYSRQYAADAMRQALLKATESVGTAFSAPNDYLWGITRKYYDFKIYDSDYKFVTNEVPFFAIVLHGSIPLYSEYVNFKADTTEYKLKLIESGVYPSFLLTYESPSDLIYTDSAAIFSCQYREYREMIKEYYEIFSELADAVGDSRIVNHSADAGVSVTEYENGVKVVVNFDTGASEYNGEHLDGQSYRILPGKAVPQ